MISRRSAVLVAPRAADPKDAVREAQWIENRALVSKLYFPRVLAPLSSLLPGLLDFVICLLLLAALMAKNHLTPTSALWTAPLWLLLMMAAASGTGLWLSALNVLYRDVR